MRKSNLAWFWLAATALPMVAPAPAVAQQKTAVAIQLVPAQLNRLALVKADDQDAPGEEAPTARRPEPDGCGGRPARRSGACWGC